MMLKIALLTLTLLSASACAASGSAIKPGCEWAKPIWLSQADVLTEATEMSILEHNETWQRICE